MGRAGYPLIDGAHQRRFGDAGDAKAECLAPGTRYRRLPCPRKFHHALSAAPVEVTGNFLDGLGQLAGLHGEPELGTADVRLPAMVQCEPDHGERHDEPLAVIAPPRAGQSEIVATRTAPARSAKSTANDNGPWPCPRLRRT